MVSLVNSHTNATRIGWHLWEIDLRFTPWLSPGWLSITILVIDLVRNEPFLVESPKIPYDPSKSPWTPKDPLRSPKTL